MSTIVITGASDGIGAAAARRLAARGESLVLVGRSPGKTAVIGAELGVPCFAADFADLGQVRTLADDLWKACPRIDVLANNAGAIMGRHRTLTCDGFEKTLQVNHLAPFLLTTLLMPVLIDSRATVIQTASAAARYFARFDLDDLGAERRYRPQTAYGNGKLANILFTRELHRRFHHLGVSAVAFHPGLVASGFARDTTPALRALHRTPLRHLLAVSPDRGADQLVWLATGTPAVDWQPGEYYERRRIGPGCPEARDPDLARRLWDRSAALLSL